jgi:hypothetical protein
MKVAVLVAVLLITLAWLAILIWGAVHLAEAAGLM